MGLRQNEEFLKKAYHKALVPCILSVLSGNINILADGILVGRRLGTNALAKVLIYIPFWFLRLDGRNTQVTQMMLVMGVGNVALDLVFLYLFDWGVGGAALASVLSTAAACALGFARLCDKKSGFHFGFRPFRKDISFGEIARAGSPSAANNLFQTLRVSVVNALLLRFCGSGTVAAFTAVNCIAAFEESVASGVGHAGHLQRRIRP